MERSSKVLYPLTIGNIEAVLDHYFQEYPVADVTKETHDRLIKTARINMLDIEDCCAKAQPHIGKVRKGHFKDASRCRLLDIALAAFKAYYGNDPNMTSQSYFYKAKETLKKAYETSKGEED